MIETAQPLIQVTPEKLTQDLVRLANGMGIYRGRDVFKYDTPQSVVEAVVNTEGYIVPDIPRTGLGYVLDDGLLLEASHAFGMNRLNYIPQLARLNDPDNKPEHSVRADNFYHTRFTHSLDVCAIASVIAVNCRLDQSNTTAVQIGALTHDVLTPAGGDTTKIIDRATFDEDAHYEEHLRSDRVTTFCEQNSVDTELVLQVVTGEGALSDIRDFADKLAYVARDLDAFTAPFESLYARIELLPARKDTITFLKTLPNQGEAALTVWENTSIIDDRLVIEDPEKLYTFLKLRAFLFRDLYTNPDARYNEALIYSSLLQYLYSESLVTKKISLIRMR